MSVRIEFTPEQEAEIKRLYARTLTPVQDIAALMGVSRKTIRDKVRLWGLPARRPACRPIALAHAIRGAVMADLSAGRLVAPPLSADALRERRAAVALRILEAVEQEIAAAQRVLAVLDPSNGDETDRTTRALVSISRLLRDAATLNQPDDGTPTDDSEQDPAPADIDTFRNELARRIRGIVAAERRRRGAVPEGDVEGGS